MTARRRGALLLGGGNESAAPRRPVTLRFLPFVPCHAIGARAHPSQAAFQWMLDDATPLQTACWVDLWSALDGDALVALAGMHDVEGRASGWMLFTDKIAPRHFVGIHRVVRRTMRELAAIGDPLFVHVDPGNEKAARWAALLGMSARALDRMPNGRTLARMTA